MAKLDREVRKMKEIDSVRQFVLKYARFENVVGDNAKGTKTLIELETINQALLKAQEQEKENELLKEIIKSLFDKGCPLHQYMDNKFGLTIEVDDECSIMKLGEFKGVNLDKKLKEVLE